MDSNFPRKSDLQKQPHDMWRSSVSPIPVPSAVWPEPNCREHHFRYSYQDDGCDASDFDTLQANAPQLMLNGGNILYHQYDTFDSIYVVRSGSLKTTHTQADGSEQVIGFHFPGDIIGMDGVHRSRYYKTARALETSAFCALPFSWLESLCLTMPGIQHHLFQRLSQEIINEARQLAILGTGDADHRLASLLLDISNHHATHGRSATRFRLSMSRSDIASYLGLRVETVSRALNRLSQEGLIAVRGREMELRQLDRLKLIAINP